MEPVAEGLSGIATGIAGATEVVAPAVGTGIGAITSAAPSVGIETVGRATEIAKTAPETIVNGMEAAASPLGNIPEELPTKNGGTANVFDKLVEPDSAPVDRLTTPAIENADPSAPEIKTDVIQPETETPKKVTFGSIEVTEDLKTDLLTFHEKKLYMGGFAILKDVVNASGDNITKMVLTNPDIVSGITGIQPLVSMDTGEAVILYQSFRRAGYDLGDDYAFFDFGIGIENGKAIGNIQGANKMFMNVPAAENVLNKYQKELGITLPENKQLTKSEIIKYTQDLLNSSDIKKANLAHGLLSGFPLEDCQWALEKGFQANPIQKLNPIEDPQQRFLNPVEKNGKIEWHLGTIPESVLSPSNYEMGSSKNHFLPDTRTSIPQGSTRNIVEGFGLRWVAPFPPQESTIKHAQKILQINRETGLLDFVNQQRETFNVSDNVKAINVGKELFNKAHTDNIAKEPPSVPVDKLTTPALEPKDANGNTSTTTGDVNDRAVNDVEKEGDWENLTKEQKIDRLLDQYNETKAMGRDVSNILDKLRRLDEQEKEEARRRQKENEELVRNNLELAERLKRIEAQQKELLLMIADVADKKRAEVSQATEIKNP